MKNNEKKPFEFTGGQIAEIEWVLVKSIEAFYEIGRPHEIKGNVQDFFIKFCFDKQYPLKETLELIKPLLKNGIQLEMKDIVPDSKRGQEHFVRGTMFAMLSKSGAIWNENKTNEMMARLCELTGISKEFASPIVNLLIKQRKREVIEKDLYSFIGTHVAPIEDVKTRRLMAEEVINAFAEELNVEPKYIKGVLKAKKKKDEAEAIRLVN